MRLTLTASTMLAVLVAATAACSSGTTTGTDEQPRATSTTEHAGDQVDGTDEGRYTVFSPDGGEIVFSGPVGTSANGSRVVLYEPNAWYDEASTARLPTVGNVEYFLDAAGECRAVGREAFLDAADDGRIVTVVPASGGSTSTGESIPLWLEGDWLVHDGCSPGERIVRVH